MQYQFWAHKSGDKFAVAIKDERPVSISTDLSQSEVWDADGNLLNPSEFNFDYQFEGNEDDYTLVE